MVNCSVNAFFYFLVGEKFKKVCRPLLTSAIGFALHVCAITTAAEDSLCIFVDNHCLGKDKERLLIIHHTLQNLRQTGIGRLRALFPHTFRYDEDTLGIGGVAKATKNEPSPRMTPRESILSIPRNQTPSLADLEAVRVAPKPRETVSTSANCTSPTSHQSNPPAAYELKPRITNLQEYNDWFRNSKW